MKTTEIFVEQVLIGFIVLGLIITLVHPCSLASLPVFDSLPALQTECNSAAAESPCHVQNAATGEREQNSTLLKLGLGALLVGLAYFLGLLYDRFADTLCADWEQHNRLQVALRDVEGGGDATLPDNGDPFPEDKIRFHIQKNTSLVEWADYLRSRMRLTRALATLMPALGVTIAIVTRNPSNAQTVAIGLLAIYLALPFLSSTGRKLFEEKGLYPPKTRESDRTELNKYWRAYRHKKKEPNKYRGVRIKWWWLLLEPTSWGVIAAMLLAFVYAAGGWLVALVFGGLTYLIGRVWWRISRTFFDYVKTAYELEKVFKKDRKKWNSNLKNSMTSAELGASQSD